MKKIKIRDKEYNCSNRVYWHIKGLKSENECFNMEIKSHEQSEYELEQENTELKARINKTLHRIQLLQTDGEVTIRDLTELVNELKGDWNEEERD